MISFLGGYTGNCMISNVMGSRIYSSNTNLFISHISFGDCEVKKPALIKVRHPWPVTAVITRYEHGSDRCRSFPTAEPAKDFFNQSPCRKSDPYPNTLLSTTLWIPLQPAVPPISP